MTKGRLSMLHNDSNDWEHYYFPRDLNFEYGGEEHQCNVKEIFINRDGNAILVGRYDVDIFSKEVDEKGHKIDDLVTPYDLEAKAINASAYCDETGELYFAVGNEIRIVDAEGNVSTLLSLPEGEVVTKIQKDIKNNNKFVFIINDNNNDGDKKISLFDPAHPQNYQAIDTIPMNNAWISSITYLKNSDKEEVIYSGDKGTYKYNLEAQVTKPEIASTYPTQNAEVTYGCDSVSFTFTEAYPSETFDIDITQDGNTFDGEYSWNVSDDGKKVIVKFPSKLPLGSYQVSLGDEAFPDIYSLPFSINFPDLNTAEVSTASNASYPSFSFQFADTIPQLENPQLKIDGEPVNVEVASLIVNDDNIDLNNNSYKFTNGQHLIQIIEDGNTVFEFTYSSTVGIDNLSRNKNSLPYPNPCSSGISLNVPLPSNAKISTILIFNTQNKIIMQQYVGQNTTNAQLDVDELPSGTYIIGFLTEQGLRKGKKFVKQ